MSATAEPAAPKRPRWLLWAIVGAVVLGAIGWLALSWQAIQWRIWVNGADQKEYQDKLIHETDPDLVPFLVEGMRDTAKGFNVRHSLANVLIKKSRMAEVTSALTDPSLAVRIVALRALLDKPYFQDQYVKDESWHVAETLEAWIKDASLPHREDALDYSSRVFPPPQAPPEFLATLRAAFAGSKGASAAPLRERAATALGHYRDCESAPAILAAARAEEDPHAKLKMIQGVVELFDAPGSPCAKELPEAEVRQAVAEAFDHPGEGDLHRAVRLAALLQYRKHLTWLPDRLDRVRALLADPKSNTIERKHALEVLLAAKDEPTWEEIPRRFHDPDPLMRSQLVTTLGSEDAKGDSPSYEGCLIGIIRDEPPSARRGDVPFAVEFAFRRLRVVAGEWVGFEGKLKAQGASIDADMRRRIDALVRTGSMGDPAKGEPVVTRAQVVEAWWRWLAKENGVTDSAQVDDIQKTRAAFWEKAHAGDVLGAAAILERPAAERRNLWSYERGWLEAHASK